MVAVDGLADLDAPDPTVVSVSDVHGHPDRLESALTTLADHPEHGAIVERDGGTVRWVGGDDYVLVLAGDMIDRGPASQATLALVERLRQQAPPGHVRHLVGNHELALLYPSPPEWDRFYADHAPDALRRALWARVLAGDVAVAFDGHRHAYVHAGSPDGVDPGALNDGLRAVAERLVDRVGHDDERAAFDRVLAEHCPELSVPTEGHPRDDPDAGVVWLDRSFLPADAPPQVVGHTAHESVTRRGSVVCIDTVLGNVGSPGGESVLVETPGDLRALSRTANGGVADRPV